MGDRASRRLRVQDFEGSVNVKPFLSEELNVEGDTTHPMTM